MFTGIIQQLGRVKAFQPNEFGRELLIDPCNWGHMPAIGDSIAVNGCCLTVAVQPGAMSSAGFQALRFDVIRQTLAVTALGDLKVGQPVNLEHAVTPQTMLGGHVVQGHVDAMGMVVEVRSDATQWRLRIEPPGEAMECIVEKGSIAVDGVSLTVAMVDQTTFEVALIPTTLKLSNLGSLKAGSRVNLETDYIAKIVVNWLRRTRG